MAQICGFDVVCAGKGSTYLSTSTAVNPDNVWQYHGFSAERIARNEDKRAPLHNLCRWNEVLHRVGAGGECHRAHPQPEGLAFPPSSVDDLATVLRPRSEGGVLNHKGTVECAADTERDGRPIPQNIRHGVYVVIEAADDFIKRSLASTTLERTPAAATRDVSTLPPGGFGLSVSVLRAGLLGQATGSSTYFTADVVARAKRNLSAVRCWTATVATRSTVRFGRPSSPYRMRDTVGLAYDMRLKRPVRKTRSSTGRMWNNDESASLIGLRRRWTRSSAMPRAIMILTRNNSSKSK